jgi:hypothetical protein
MPHQTDDLEQMDGATSMAVCKGIGERLRQTLTVDAARFPPRLQNLLDELQRRENDISPRSN